ncbi:hypothetical protein [Actinacidiphila epipremni]|jgi:hypothetical protein|uniref:Uncharacterized protein n=1 Tax=Actinacidiphila epipremni TaxID=2053013 RepID=A0ABX0ZQB5_9ACTN|nr:hypothetical protein [Actinacidiphila epipremni]NJP43994.1 hypothetical protein [Actinacidiphila epipremni]
MFRHFIRALGVCAVVYPFLVLVTAVAWPLFGDSGTTDWKPLLTYEGVVLAALALVYALWRQATRD